MTELLTIIAKGLVEEPDKVFVTQDEKDAEGVTVYHIHAAESDMGRIIGKQGRIAKAIRTVARSAAIRNNERISVEIDWYSKNNPQYGGYFYAEKELTQVVLLESVFTFVNYVY